MSCAMVKDEAVSRITESVNLIEVTVGPVGPDPRVLVGVAPSFMCQTAQGPWDCGGWHACANPRQARMRPRHRPACRLFAVPSSGPVVVCAVWA